MLHTPQPRQVRVTAELGPVLGVKLPRLMDSSLLSNPSAGSATRATSPPASRSGQGPGSRKLQLARTHRDSPPGPDVRRQLLVEMDEEQLVGSLHGVNTVHVLVPHRAGRARGHSGGVQVGVQDDLGAVGSLGAPSAVGLSLDRGSRGGPWCGGVRRAGRRFSTEVGPSSRTHSSTWWASHQWVGASQPVNTQCRSRTSRARRMCGGTTRLVAAQVQRLALGADDDPGDGAVAGQPAGPGGGDAGAEAGAGRRRGRGAGRRGRRCRW